MASVFLSYDREDAGMARPIAAALEKAGHSVWWDRHIKGGAQYSKEIDKALKSAHAIVVLWSERSVESAWVRDEAAAGRDTARLVPVSLDSTEPPLGFRQYQTIELEGWRGRGRVPRLAELLGAIDALGSAETEADTPPRVPRPGSIARSRRFMPIGLAVMLLVAAAILAWWLSRPSIPIPTVAVAAADGSAPSQALARDLLTKLGSLQAAQADSIMLAEHGEGAGRGADLVFEVGGTAGSTEVEANLVLLSGNNRTVLWSRDFRQPLSKFPDLKQHVAYTAALVLDCTLEGISAKAQRLDERTLKLYLNGCAASAGAIHEQFPGLAATFRGVVREAPEFEAAWARLLLVEANIAEAHPLDDIARPIGEELRKHIAAARKLNPTLAEADIAEASLLPKQAIGQRVQVLERAVRNNPDNPHAASTLSQYLGSVGRMRDAVRLARRAVQLAPLSPSARETLIAALTYSGNFDAARDELER